MAIVIWRGWQKHRLSSRAGTAGGVGRHSLGHDFFLSPPALKHPMTPAVSLEASSERSEWWPHFSRDQPPRFSLSLLISVPICHPEPQRRIPSAHRSRAKSKRILRSAQDDQRSFLRQP